MPRPSRRRLRRPALWNLSNNTRTSGTGWRRMCAPCRDGLRRLGLPIEDSPTPIVSLRVGSTEQMQRIHQTLKDRGLIVPYVSGYSGVGPEGVLRIAVFATHTAAMIHQLLDELHRVL